MFDEAKTLRISDIEIKRTVDVSALGWPERGEAGFDGEDGGFRGNRSYCDLRRMTWAEARAVFEAEGLLLLRILKADDPEDEEAIVLDELYEDSSLYGLDIGIASCVVALSAARCIPFSSCSGGLLREDHHEWHPLVAFYARPEHISLLLECAVGANCGLESAAGGYAVLYGRCISDLRAFAAKVIDRRREFQKLKFRPQVKQENGAATSNDGQLNLL